MFQQRQHRLRPVTFPTFASFAESTTHDTKTGYRSYSRAQLEPEGHSAVGSENHEPRLSVVIRDAR